ncbi:MAG: FHA domain-containing protein [Chthoniobacterales bacterium]|nr:FHA domain-containing protein [Chthoniobacterales bacterium]
MAYLVITLNGQQVGRHELRGEAVIGRATDCEVWINDLGISRRHAKIELRPDGRWFVYDLKSRNGVYLRDVQVTDQILSDGDVLKIGPARIMFHEVGKHNERPSDPTDMPVEEITSIFGDDQTRMPPTMPAPESNGRQLPQAKATVAKPPAPIYIHEDELKVAEPGGPAAAKEGPKPLAFTRPPAKPIVERREE